LAALLPAASAAEERLERCAKLEDPAERLACYDESAGRVPASATYLTRAWKLGPDDRAPRRLADFVAYRPDYIILRWTSRPNSRPRSPATGPSNIADLDRNEIKLQGSLKTELISPAAFERTGVSGALQHAGIDSVRLWFAYTQQMNWQAFNRGESRPITDTNYEPELILTLGARNAGNGLKLVNLGFSHQSNGLDPAEHRGWSRLYLQGGWEWGRVALLPRLWHVVPQSDDDNPNIRRYMGSGDLVGRYQAARGSVTSLLVRQNLGSGKGFLQLDWATPVLQRLGGLKFHVQLTSGYGETLIDYNHHQTTLGAGVSFGDW
jgi:phospholipase A1